MRPTRRLLALFLGSVFARPVLGQTPPPPSPPLRPSDRGIGGTGARPDEPEGDRGIGGTGVIGTIRRFGTIYVNDLRIAYPTNVSVTIDGAQAQASDLRVGQVVRAVAQRGSNGLMTNRITVESEVVGRVERIGIGQFTVLGQTVSTASIPNVDLDLGQRVAVHGNRRPDGTIEATLVEARETGLDRVAGPVQQTADGLAIGGLRLRDLDPSLAGSRAVVEGTAERGGFAVFRAADDRAPFAQAVSRLSIEGYVERLGGGLKLGSGLELTGVSPAGLPRSGSALVVISATPARDGPARVDRINVETRDRVPLAQEPGRNAAGQSGGLNSGGAPSGREPGSRPGSGQRAPIDQPGRSSPSGRPESSGNPLGRAGLPDVKGSVPSDLGNGFGAPGGASGGGPFGGPGGFGSQGGVGGPIGGRR